jgi:hypothetical protein
VNVDFPEIDERRMREVVAVGYFESGAYLPDDGECRGLGFLVEGENGGEDEVMCLDPPPLRIRFRLLEVLYGPHLPSWLPCPLRAAHERFAFTSPISSIRLPLDTLGDLELRDSDDVQIRGGFAYLRRGVTLTRIREAFAAVSSSRTESLERLCTPSD